MASVVALGASADVAVVDGLSWTYYLNGDDTATIGIAGEYGENAISQATTGAVTVPDFLDGHRVTAIANDAFTLCSHLTAVTISTNVVTIGDYAFFGCNGLSFVVIPGEVRKLGGYVFSSCAGLREITIGSGVTNIGNGLLMASPLVTNIVVTGGGRFVFINGLLCTVDQTVVLAGALGLGTVTVPSSAVSVNTDALTGGGSLSNIAVAAGNTAFVSTNGLLCRADLSELVAAPAVLRAARIPEGVRKLDYDVFENSQIEYVSIPSSVQDISGYAFSGCARLASIVVPSSVTSLGPDCFGACDVLSAVVFLGAAPSVDGNGGVYVDTPGVTNYVLDGVWTATATNMWPSIDGRPVVTMPAGMAALFGTSEMPFPVFALGGRGTAVSATDGTVTIGGQAAFSVRTPGDGWFSFRWQTAGTTASYARDGEVLAVASPSAWTVVTNTIIDAQPHEWTFAALGASALFKDFTWTPAVTNIVSTDDGDSVTVPVAWLVAQGLVPKGLTDSEYAVAATNVYANGLSGLKSYVAGLTPTNPASQFLARITVSNGVPVVGWTPDLGTNRAYTVSGSVSPKSSFLSPTNGTHRFFKVHVSMP